MFRLSFTKIWQSSIASLLISAFLVAGIGMTPRTSEAVYVTGGPVTTLELPGPLLTAAAATAVSTGLSATANTSLAAKEWTFDMLAWMALNLVLHQMSKSIVTWINSGFQGSPAFVTDLKAFFMNVADKVAGEFIWSSGLKALCSPFRLNVRMALDIQYRQARGQTSGATQCTLSGVMNNINGFVESASITNWNSWYQVALRPENNVYGALLLSQEQLSIKVEGAKELENIQLNFGSGFLSRKHCEKVEGIERCHIITPGAVIEEQLNVSLGSGQRRVEIADEINEIIAALFTQLVSRAFAGVGGLLGMTQTGYGTGSGSYYTQLASSAYVGQSGSAPATSTCGSMCTDSGVNRPKMQLPVEIGYYEANATVMKLITDLEKYRDGSCDPLRALAPQLTAEKDRLQGELDKGTTTIAKLTELAAAYDSGTAAQRTAVLQEYYQMTTVPYLLHSTNQITYVRQYVTANVQGLVFTYKNALDASCMETAGA